MAFPISCSHPDDLCAAFLDALPAVVDGEVGSLCAARAEAHAARCPSCARRFAGARAYKRVLRRAGESERAPAELRDAVMASLRGVRGSRTH
jgi:mycothiol system anti-sigma-R factor